MSSRGLHGRRRWRRRLLAALLVLGVFAIPRPAPATVAEQRARLPPAAECDDPVAGVWKSHRFDSVWGDWYIFTLTVHREPSSPTQLLGTIRSHCWNGTASEEEPPACRAGLAHWAIMMTAEGSYSSDGTIRFFGTSWRPEQTFCGRPPAPGQYNLDNFSGTIDPAIQEFQSVNNDGGRAVNEPHVFRRISCQQEPPAPHVNPVAPPFFPDAGGCSCL